MESPHPADYNMAADETLLMLHSHRIIPPTLRIWSFSSASVAMGRFSKSNETVNVADANDKGITVVRRFTGGGATFNDPGGETDWTFVSAGNSTMDKYNEISRALYSAMSFFGLVTQLRNTSDISTNGKKISGLSAARSRGTILVHGTLLVDPDLQMMDRLLKGLSDGNGGHILPSSIVTTLNKATGRKVHTDEISKALMAGFSRFGKLVVGSWSPMELDLIARLRNRYIDDSWTYCR